MDPAFAKRTTAAQTFPGGAQAGWVPKPDWLQTHDAHGDEPHDVWKRLLIIAVNLHTVTSLIVMPFFRSFPDAKIDFVGESDHFERQALHCSTRLQGQMHFQMSKHGSNFREENYCGTDFPKVSKP